MGNANSIRGGKHVSSWQNDSFFETRFGGECDMYHVLVEHSPDAVIVHRDDRILFVNPAAVKLFRATDETTLRRHSLLDFIPGNEQTRILDVVNQLQNKGLDSSPLELSLIRCDGTQVDVEMTATRATWNEMVIVQGMIRDVTFRKAEQELQTLAREAKLFQAIVAKVADKTLNPLTTIEGYLKFSRDGDTPIPSDLLLDEVDSIKSMMSELIHVALHSSSANLEDFKRSLEYPSDESP